MSKRLEILFRHRTLRTVARFGTMLSVVAMLAFVVGCPDGPVPPDECAEDADCDDMDACTTDTCDVDTGDCTSADIADCCADDADCADGETCVGNTCTPTCVDNADCDDDLACTDDACVDEACAFTAVVCDDDGDLCTTEACSEAAGGCESTDVVCDEGEECDPDTGACEAVEVPPLVDANPDVDFGGLTEGDPVDLVAPDPTSGGDTARQPPDDCTCAWTTDGSGTFDPDDECATTYTPSADDTTLSVTVTCPDVEATFDQPLTVAPPECTVDADCDDGDACNGEETCVDNECQDGTAMDCDDGDACTDDSCADDACVNTAVVCDDGFECDADTGDCVETAPCADDTDCDDGLFCNGAETCDLTTDPDNPVCVDGDDPCADTVCTCQGEDQDPVCDEGDTAAECSCPECPGISFTLNQDDLSGSTGDDIFDAPRVFSDGAGGLIDSLQTGDEANGLAGTDTLDATLSQGNNPVVTLAGIENLNFTNFAAETINASNISGAEKIGWIGGTANLTVNTLANKVDAVMSGIATAGNTFLLSFQAGATTSPTTGSTDEISLDVSGTTTGTFQFTTAANGFETLNVDSTGGNANTLTAITQTTGTTVATIKFTGDADLTVSTVPATALTIDASSMSGALQLGAGTEDTTYAEFSNPATNWTQITGGSGNDLLIFEDTLTSTDFTSGTIDLGDGTDVVQSTFGASFSAASKLRSVEEVRFNATADLTYNFSGTTNLETITIEEDGTGHTFTLSNVPVTSTANTWPTLNYRGDNSTGASQTFDDATYTATGNTGSSDTLTVNVGNRGTNLNTGTSTTNVMNIGDTELTAGGFETLNIDVADGPATFNGITASTLITLDVDSTTSNVGTNVTLGTVVATGTTILTVDASGVTGNFNATLDFLASGATITTGAGNDTVIIGTTSAAAHSINVLLGDGNNTYTGDTSTGGTDTVTAGTGNDTFTPSAGADTITTGGGTDTVDLDNNDTDEAVIDTITDFTAGVGGDNITFDFSSIEAMDSAVAGLVGDVTDANNTSIVGNETFDITLVTADGGVCIADMCVYDDDLAASVNANMAALLVDIAASTITIDCSNAYDADDAFLVAYSDGSGNTRIGFLVSEAATQGDTDGVVEGADILILSGVDVDDLVAANFNAWD